MAVLKTEDFTLEIICQKTIFDIDKVYRDNLSINIIKNYKYSVFVEFFCLRSQRVDFINKLTMLYQTLKQGKARLNEEWEEDNYLEIESDGIGHFSIGGCLNNWGVYSLKFEENMDQTYLKNFIKQLNEELK